MNLLWILSGPLEHRDNRLFSPIGSHRLRCLEPAAALARRGHRIALVQAEALVGKLDSPELRAADAVIVSKQFADITPLLEAVKARDLLVVVDLCDDVLRLDHLRGPYAGILEKADAFTVASPVLANRIRADRKAPVAVVPDCVEGEAHPPTFDAEPGQPLRLLWFGQPGNLDALDMALPDLGRRLAEVSPALTIVTQLSSAVVARFPERRDGLPIRCLPWSPEIMRASLRDCDLVIVPSAPTEHQLAKSSNRVASTLWAGRLPVAFPLPSYRPFADSALLAERLADGLSWALAHRTEVPARIARGQALIGRVFTPQAVAERWEKVLTDFLENRPT